MANLIELLGKIPRSNVDFPGYQEDPEYFEEAGKQGIKFRSSPDWLSKKRAFTLGNTVFIPPGSAKESQNLAETLEPFSTMTVRQIKEQPHRYLAEEEIPHVAQYRQKGLLGFLGSYLGDLIKHRGQGHMYNKPGTLESFHYGHPSEKIKLRDIALRK